MKMYLNNEQTAKLIELGFETPKSYHDIEWDGTEAYDYHLDYSIGELIEMLPKNIDAGILPDSLTIYVMLDIWTVEYSNALGTTYIKTSHELIDALYNMVVELKEEGVI